MTDYQVHYTAHEFILVLYICELSPGRQRHYRVNLKSA
jgi:hypothetical protein